MKATLMYLLETKRWTGNIHVDFVGRYSDWFDSKDEFDLFLSRMKQCTGKLELLFSGPRSRGWKLPVLKHLVDVMCESNIINKFAISWRKYPRGFWLYLMSQWSELKIQYFECRRSLVNSSPNFWKSMQDNYELLAVTSFDNKKDKEMIDYYTILNYAGRKIVQREPMIYALLPKVLERASKKVINESDKNNFVLVFQR